MNEIKKQFNRKDSMFSRSVEILSGDFDAPRRRLLFLIILRLISWCCNRMFEKYGAARLELREVSPVQGDLKTLIHLYL